MLQITRSSWGWPISIWFWWQGYKPRSVPPILLMYALAYSNMSRISTFVWGAMHLQCIDAVWYFSLRPPPPTFVTSSVPPHPSRLTSEYKVRWAGSRQIWQKDPLTWSSHHRMLERVSGGSDIRLAFLAISRACWCNAPCETPGKAATKVPIAEATTLMVCISASGNFIQRVGMWTWRCSGKECHGDTGEPGQSD